MKVKDFILLIQECGSDDDEVVGFNKGGELWAFKADGVVYVEERTD